MENNKAFCFDTVSAAYDRIRPGYVEDLYHDLFEYQKLDTDSKTLEIGIGSGQATGPILETGCTVIAVEPGTNFSEMVREKYASYPKFDVKNIDFMKFNGVENSYDLVYSATAFHWIPENLGYPLVYSLLRPGGTFARFANRPGPNPKQTELHHAIQRLYQIYFGQKDTVQKPIEELAEERARAARIYGFAEVEYKIYHRNRTLTSDEYLLLLSTYSDHMMMEEKKRKEFFTKIKKEIDSFGGFITIHDSLDLELARKL